VGGAERTARKQRQQAQASKSVVRARNAASDRRKIIIGIVAVVVVAAAVIGGVLWTISSRNRTEGQTINPDGGTSLAADVVQKRDGVVVTVGKPGATSTIDVYADFLCPICGTFESTYRVQIEQAINNGQLQVKYHMVPLLNTRSAPPGYSLDSANAALAAADAGKFVQFHDALFKSQPEEGGRGYDKQQLIDLGKGVGITDPNFASEVNAGTYNDQINTAFTQIENDPSLQQDIQGQKSFGTPTVVSKGQIINWQDAGWLGRVIGG
jgi:protein-disulfide isomerase